MTTPVPTPKPSEFKNWQYQTPVVSIGADLEFTNWMNQAPVEDLDETYNPSLPIRRRVFEF